jgi:ADP-ribosylglycohydrolase
MSADGGFSVTNTLLLDKIYAAMMAGAIGDAMGGPLEGWPYDRIASTYGVVDRLLSYDSPPDYHNHFATAPGTVTDDTRLKHIICRAIINCGGLPRRGDLVKACVQGYYNATSDLERGFLEEYMLGGIYAGEKLIWGGRMTNGFLMANAPIGLICPCDPVTAFATSYAVDFISDGYAKYSAALAAAVIAAALCPQTNPKDAIEAALEAAQSHRVEGPLTRQWQWYDHVFQLNERLVRTAVDIALQHQDVFSLRDTYYAKLRVNALGSEAAQTLAVALGMVVAAGGNVRQTVIGCVNYGRDNDSYATVGGAIAGALNGIHAIPSRWRDGVLAANPKPDMRVLALGLTEVAFRRYTKMRSVVAQVAQLL